jgi:hypothetical protein
VILPCDLRVAFTCGQLAGAAQQRGADEGGYVGQGRDDRSMPVARVLSIQERRVSFGTVVRTRRTALGLSQERPLGGFEAVGTDAERLFRESVLGWVAELTVSEMSASTVRHAHRAQCGRMRTRRGLLQRRLRGCGPMPTRHRGSELG